MLAKSYQGVSAETSPSSEWGQGASAPPPAREARCFESRIPSWGKGGGLGKFATTVTFPPPPFEQAVARPQYK
jgi:hypothetical protein